MRRSIAGIASIAIFLAGCGATAEGAAAPTSLASVASTRLTITVRDLALAPLSMEAPIGSELDIQFINQDLGVPHNLSLFADATSMTKLFESEIITGPHSNEFRIPGQPAGDYRFHCLIHPNMVAELRIGDSS